VFEIGAFSVLGVASITLLSLTAIPAMLSLLPHRAGGRRARFRLAEQLDLALDGGLGRLSRFTIQRSGTIVIVWLVPPPPQAPRLPVGA